MLRIVIAVHAHLLTRSWLQPPDRERGQATAEYALVLLAAATVAVLLLAWVTKSGRVGKLFDTIFDAVSAKVK
jgi:Flp pilus assembly pilin Flp